MSPTLTAPLVQLSNDPERAAVFLAAHPSGWVRQASLAILQQQATPLTIGMLIVRSSDWVGEVRAAARNALMKAIERDGADVLIPCLPLIEQLGTADARCRDVARELADLAASASPAALRRSLGSPDRRSRRSSARLLARRGLAPTALDDAFAQDDPVTFGLVADACLDSASREVVERLFRGSPVARVRERALHRLVQDDGEDCRHVGHALFDRNASVRAAAQSYAREQGIDLARRYANALAAGHVRRGQAEPAIRGLVDIGARSHVGLIATFASHSSSRVREAACAALEALDIGGSRGVVLGLAGDPSRRVARRAGLALVRPPLDPEGLDRLWLAATQRSDDALLPALKALDRWRALVYAGRGLQSGAPQAARLGLAVLDYVMATWNSSFSAPSVPMRDELSATLPLVLRTVDESRSALLRNSCRPFLGSL